MFVNPFSVSPATGSGGNPYWSGQLWQIFPCSWDDLTHLFWRAAALLSDGRGGRPFQRPHQLRDRTLLTQSRRILDTAPGGGEHVLVMGGTGTQTDVRN